MFKAMGAKRTMRGKSIYLAQVCIFIVTLLIGVACSAATPRILMVGDSWAWFMYMDRSLQQALSNEGLGEYEEMGLYTTVPGSTAAQWTNPKWLLNVKRELELYPSIDIVHLSLGGNDFLNHWYLGMPEAEKSALYEQVVRDIETVVRYILDIRPTLRVAIVEYDFIHKTKLGCTMQDLNRAGSELAHMKMEMSKRIDRCGYVQVYGLMQYCFGAPELAPKSVPLPGQAKDDFKPFPGGDIQYGNSPKAMFDKIHLSQAGYYQLAEHCVRVLYKQWITEQPGQVLAAGSNAIPSSAGR